MILILDNIRSVYNVGSIFRTADAVGVSEIFLCGVTPQPVDRFGRDRKDFAKTALGSEKVISWSFFKSAAEAIDFAKKKKLSVVALEQSSDSEDYKKISEKISFDQTALVLGEETKGLPEEVLGLCDVVAEIPMRGEKESLNVSVAAGVMLFSFPR